MQDSVVVSIVAVVVYAALHFFEVHSLFTAPPLNVEAEINAEVEDLYDGLRQDGAVAVVPASEMNSSLFYTHMRQSEPLVIQGLSSLPAVSRPATLWTDTYLTEKGGDASVGVEVSPTGRFAHYAKGFSKREMRFEEFLDQ
jgi:hypothetical protein